MLSVTIKGDRKYPINCIFSYLEHNYLKYNFLMYVNHRLKRVFSRASLITGMEYGMERWNGKWNGTVNVHSCSQLVLQMLSFKVELATVCLGLLSHRRGCMRKSSACCQHSSLSCITMSELAGPRRPARTMHRSHAYYC